MVGGGIARPDTAPNSELDLVRCMPHLLQGLDAQCHLEIGIEEVLLCPLAGRLMVEIALRHPQICRAVATVRGAGPGPGDHGDRGNCAPRLHLEACIEAGHEGGTHVPACPEPRLLLLNLEADRKEAPLAEAPASGKFPAVLANNAAQLLRQERTLLRQGLQVLDDVIYQLFYGSSL